MNSKIFDLHTAAISTLPADKVTLTDARNMFDAMRIVLDDKKLDEYDDFDDSMSIKSPLNLQAKLIDRFKGVGITGDRLPWQKTHDKFRFKGGDLIIWSGYNGHKKSMVMDQTAFDLATQGKKVLICSFEMDIVETIYRMAIKAIGNDNPTEAMIVKFVEYCHEKIYIYDQRRTVDYKRILKLCNYASVELGVDHIMIDSLMKCGISSDDYNTQKDFVDKLGNIANNQNNCIHLVAHCRKPNDSSVKYVPDRYKIHGSADISNQADSIIVVWTDIERKDETQKPLEFQDKEIMKRTAMKISIEKNRHGSFEGRFNLDFDNRSLQTFDKKISPYWELLK